MRATVTAWKRPEALRRFLNSWAVSDLNGFLPLWISVDGNSHPDILPLAESFKNKIPGLIIRPLPQHRGLKDHVLTCLSEAGDQLLWILEEDCVVHPRALEFVQWVTQNQSRFPSIAGFSTYAQPHIPGSGFPFRPLKKGSDFYFLDYPSSSGCIWNPEFLHSFCQWMGNHPDFPSGVPGYLLTWPESSWKKWMSAWLIITGKTSLYPTEGISTNMGDAGQHHRKSSGQFQGNLKNGIWVFPDSEQAMEHYDAWFEWMGFQWDGIPVEMNVYGMKSNGKGLMVIPGHDSTALFKFGADFHPVEMNFLLQQPGQAFSLIEATHSSNFNPLSEAFWWTYHGFYPGKSTLLRMLGQF